MPKIKKAALSTLHYTGADGILSPFTRGVGAIFMLHHVQPGSVDAAEPCRKLKLTPDFLEQVIRQVRRSGFEIVSLDEAHFRLTEGDYSRPFVCFTLDDGYRDNIEHAYPVFKRHDAPFAVYVPTDYPDGRGDLWWLALENVILAVNALDVKIDGALQRFRCTTPAEKDAAFRAIYWWLRGIEEDDARAFVRELCQGIGLDTRRLCGESIMSWEEIRQLAADPRVTIGAHTRRHYALARLTLAEARAEIEESLRRIEKETGIDCRHFSYPFGDEASAGKREFELVRELGLKTAVTTRSGLIHRGCDRAALPRVPLDSGFQRTRYIKVLLSGVPFALSRLAPKASRRTAPVH